MRADLLGRTREGALGVVEGTKDGEGGKQVWGVTRGLYDDLAMIREPGYRAFRKADRFAAALNLSLEEMNSQWRVAGQDALQADHQGQPAALTREEAEKAAAAAGKAKSPWDND